MDGLSWSVYSLSETLAATETGGGGLALDLPDQVESQDWMRSLHLDLPSVREGQIVTLRFHAVSDEPVTVPARLVCAAEGHPWIAPTKQLRLGVTNEWVTVSFLVKAYAPAARFRLDLGHATQNIRVGSATLEFTAPRPTKSVLICATPRSGSTFLTSLMQSTGVLGVPREYFLPIYRRSRKQMVAQDDLPAPEARKTLDGIVTEGLSPNGVFASKLMISHLTPACSGLAGLLEGNTRPNAAPLETLSKLLPNLQLIHLERRDIVSQSVSYWMAEHDGVWSRPANGVHGDSPTEIPGYDLDELLKIYRMLTKDCTDWRGILAQSDLPQLHLTYESLLSDGPAQMGRIFDFLNIAPFYRSVPERVEVVRQGSPFKKAIIDRFRADLATLTGQGGLQ